MGNFEPDRPRGYKEDHEFTLGEKEAIKTAEKLISDVAQITNFVKQQVLPIYEELQRSQNYFEKSQNINYFTTVLNNRKKLADKLAELPIKELSVSSIPNHLKIFSAEKKVDIAKIIKSLQITNPDKYHPVNIQDYLVRAEKLSEFLKNFVLYTKQRKRGDNSYLRLGQVDIDLNTQTRPDKTPPITEEPLE
jgi:hypothetical protein